MTNICQDKQKIFKLRLQNGVEIVAEYSPTVWTPFSPSCEVMCELISVDQCRDKNVMDLAAGSGVLGITAAKHGAARVVCTDLNPDAIASSQRNWELNHLDRIHLESLQSSCFKAFEGNSNFEQKFDRIYLNPPALPDTQEKLKNRLESAQGVSAGEWNRNGQRGRLVMDSLITEGQSYLAPGGEILFIATSKNGPRQTVRLMEEFWGQGIQNVEINPDADPLDYHLDWEKRGDANWVVVHRLDIPLKDYHLGFVPQYEQIAMEEQEPNPFIKKGDNLYQKLYFIRAKSKDAV